MITQSPYMKKILFIFSICMLSFRFSNAQTEPASNPTNLRFQYIKHWGFDIAFTKSVADSFLVLKSEQPFSSQPQDGVKYQKGQWIGNAKVLSTSKADSFHVREVQESTTYYITVFAYNVNGSNTNYKQQSPLTNTLTTPASSFDNYYQNINIASSSFLQNLHDLIYNHNVVSYGQYRYNIQPNIWERDTTNGKATSFCAYSGEITVYDFPIVFGGNPGDYSKEHCLPQSWMRTISGTTSDIERADYYNLMVTNYSNANAVRSNYPYGKVVTPTFTYLNFKVGKDASNINVAEPQDIFKGDVARNMMYEMLCYNGLQGNWGLDNLNSLATQQSETILKSWNTQDPPSKEEKTKLEYIASIQGNRNPLIDHPEWADCINFRQIVAKACVAGVYDFNKEALKYQWENKTSFSFELNPNQDYKDKWIVTDLSGKIIAEMGRESLGKTREIIDLNGYQSGVYILHVNTVNGKAFVKIPYFNF